MIGSCIKCGNFEWDKTITEDGKRIHCPKCGYEWNFHRLPLFILTGCSGVGKTTTCQALLQKTQDYVIMDCDYFHMLPGKTEEDWHQRKEQVLSFSRNIMQAGKPLLWSAACIPEQFEQTYNRRFFSNIYYLALVCDAHALRLRMTQGRKIEDEQWIQGSIDFNEWFKTKSREYEYPIDVYDITERSSSEVADYVDLWVHEKLKLETY